MKSKFLSSSILIISLVSLFSLQFKTKLCEENYLLEIKLINGENKIEISS